MKDFSAAAGRLRVLPLGGKLLYTAFCVSALVGLLLSWRLYGSVVEGGGAQAYYSDAASAPAEQPAATATPSSAPRDDDGPALDLPDEATRPRVMVVRISDRKLLEVTHFHLFSVPVYVLILAHLWLLARLPSWLHQAGVAASVLVSGLHLTAPWLVRSQPSLASLVPISGAAMLLVLGVVALVPAVDMWLPRPRRAED